MVNKDKKNEYISEAYAALERLSLDERKKLEYDTRQKSLRDFRSLQKDGYEDGMADGQLLKEIILRMQYSKMLMQHTFLSSKMLI